MSRGYSAFVRGSWRSFSLPANLLTTTTTMTTMMMMMMMMIITVMIFPCTSLNRVEMTSLTPFEGFSITGPTRMEITCRFEAKNLGFFRLRRNDEVIVDIGFHEGVGVFEVIHAVKDFGCTLPRAATTRGELYCWKNNLDCSDVASYTCEISNANESNSRFLKVKSFVKSLKNIDLPSEKKKNKVSTFRCLAYVSPATHDSVTFRWTLKHKTENAKPKMTDNKVTLPKTGQRCIAVQSLHRHTLTDKDDTGTIISCSAFGRTLSKQVNIFGAKSSSTISALPDTTWLSVSKLSFLFLVLASCR
ncbi:uncharacterized protein LOC106878953 isoform X1 [Octopus bimaculoides]|uniref:uncharacterized protein LOC106878953 isoform X1 n=1 Tax=Octopus bimaculoides TaxID=37653 RepID=UPI00071D84C4|nr:uncharacterized protein LOC106878953 isoform X1 [Octopus bimaculoides]XP_052831239.1 uncharacterized protein LOC106878953 isoform X1 [Octopus bimaculoides]|eukprot:XP_014783815.1 PREDICTED: uncharacterized protein LOC106878953 [Octopus bimaculoides]